MKYKYIYNAILGKIKLVDQRKKFVYLSRYPDAVPVAKSIPAIVVHLPPST